MTNEIFSKVVLRKLERDRDFRSRVTAAKPSSFARVAMVRADRKLSVAVPVQFPRPMLVQERILRAALRAAELAVWQASGGDVLQSRTRS